MGKQNSKLAPEDIGELTESTEFTTEELRKFFKEFKEDYPSGVLTMEGMRQYCK